MGLRTTVPKKKMDKNKGRTDLLAAGRKKLQQFRQKKDGKGSSAHGKSSKKHVKSEPAEDDSDSKVSQSAPVMSIDDTEPGATAGNSGAVVSSSQHSESNLFPAETPVSSMLEGP
ncbi:hypothetical protein MLD38_014123 [Melastoma candidum]|uniref:Uncharacterized protein n=1 Tax=Melastoma candidum TaxID=119954 RepID=A0ACB9RFG7_9MYRT|nr:hypothetical protein MLD38_014123 [Melastoma candidum]